MKLYVTNFSPYARMARFMRLEKGLEKRVEEIFAKTRQPDSPYYQINPSGRVPYLVRDDGVGMENSRLICQYLDRLDGAPTFDLPDGPDGLEMARLEALARSFMDGVSVWVRELARAPDDRSATIIAHEKARAQRLADVWLGEIDHPLMGGPLNVAQLNLACTLELDIYCPSFQWRVGRAALENWLERVVDRPAFAATTPPGPPESQSAA